MEKLELNVTAQGNEIIIREGEAAPPPKEPVKIELTGAIESPADFATARKETIDKLNTNVVANYTNRTIVLTVNEASVYAAKITGKLDIHPELATLGINQNKTYTEKDLLNKLNFFGRWFSDKSAHRELLSKLQTFKARVTKDFTNSDDYKGNAAIEKLTKIEHDIPLVFDLSIPIFTNGKPYGFKVNICVSARDGGVSFWFESVELHELVQKNTEDVFETELTRLGDYIIIRQW